MHLGVILYVLPVVLNVNPLYAELNSICHLLELLGAHHILHVSRIWVKPDGALVNVEIFAFGRHTRVTSNKSAVHCQWAATSDSCQIISRYVKHMNGESEGYGRERRQITL
jgi:hypothetical protein